MNEIATGRGAERSLSADALLSVLERLARMQADLVGVTIGVRAWAPERVFTARQSESAFLWSSSPGICEVGLGVSCRFQDCLGDHWPDIAGQANHVCGRYQGLGIGACSVEPRFFGGVSFAAGERTPDAWYDFADHEFILPRLFYRLDSMRNRASLTLFATRSELDDPTRRAALVDELWRAAQQNHDGSPSGTPLVVDSQEQNPDYPSWKRQVRLATDLMQRGELEKVVLARELVLRCTGVPSVPGVLRRLLDRGDGSVCFAFRSGVSTFLGATPERLVSRRGPLIRTEALAGSAAADDPAAVETLRLGDKDRREHAFVVNEIVERLLMLGAEVSVPEKPALRQFGPVLHLRTSIEATRLDAPHVLVLAHHLHPTPAVGGIPLQVALDFIRNNESFQRGRYASPVGWFGCNGDGELVVALRSGLVRGREIRLFAGAGLVNGSEAQAEWRETELKFRSFLDALGVYTEPSSFTPS